MSITPKKQKNKFGKGLPHTMILNDNAITCIGMIPTGESSTIARRFAPTGNNAHGIEILSIIEEFREAGLIIN